MSDHDLSPAQEAANGLPTDVLEAAAEAIDACEDTGYDPEQIIDLFVRPALPVLAPAIERALLDKLIGDLHRSEELQAHSGGHEYTGLSAQGEEFFDLLWARYPTDDLPAADEREQEGAR